MKKDLLALLSIPIISLTSGCSTKEFTGTYNGVKYDGDGGGKIFINGRNYDIGSITPDTLNLNQGYTFELTNSPFGEYVSNVKPIKN